MLLESQGIYCEIYIYIYMCIERERERERERCSFTQPMLKKFPFAGHEQKLNLARANLD